MAKYSFTLQGYGAGMYDEDTGTASLPLADVIARLSDMPERYRGTARLALTVDRIGSCMYLECDGPDIGPDRIGEWSRDDWTRGTDQKPA